MVGILWCEGHECLYVQVRQLVDCDVLVKDVYFVGMREEWSFQEQKKCATRLFSRGKGERGGLCLILSRP